MDSVSLEVAHGEFMVLLGPSGCGKSTTLRMVAGLESISDGELLIDGKRVNDVPAKDRDIAMVFQSYALYPHMSVLDNLAFGLRRRDFAAAEIERRVRDVAVHPGTGRAAESETRMHFPAASASASPSAAPSCAIPKVFLFDEPLSNLDAALRVGMRGELIKLHHRLGATMIYVTHDQVEAMTMGDRICIMNGGKVAQIGAPLEVYARPADMFVASFLGSPPTNLIPGRFNAGFACRRSGSGSPAGARNTSSSASARKTSASTARRPTCTARCWRWSRSAPRRCCACASPASRTT